MTSPEDISGYLTKPNYSTCGRNRSTNFHLSLTWLAQILVGFWLENNSHVRRDQCTQQKYINIMITSKNPKEREIA